MIILQILAALLLIPMTALLLVIFNVYLINWIYLIFIAVFALIYSCLCGLVFFSSALTMWVLIILATLYILRMVYLVRKKEYPVLRGIIKSKKYKFRMSLLFPLSFLKILKLAPKSMSRELAKQTGLDIQIPQVVDLFLDSCIGTQIEIANDEVHINFEIK